MLELAVLACRSWWLNNQEFCELVLKLLVSLNQEWRQYLHQGSWQQISPAPPPPHTTITAQNKEGLLEAEIVWHVEEPTRGRERPCLCSPDFSDSVSLVNCAQLPFGPHTTSFLLPRSGACEFLSLDLLGKLGYLLFLGIILSLCV